MPSPDPQSAIRNPQSEMARSGAVSLKRRVDTANRWRENYNPLRGLIMTRVVCLLEAGERGEMADLQWLYRFVEKRYPNLRGLIKRWRGALSKLEWDIKIKSELPEGCTEAAAEAQQKTLRTAYDQIDNLRYAIQYLAHAEFRGYALLNKHRAAGGENDGAVVHLEPIDQWNWVKDGLNSEYYYNPEARSAGPDYFKIRNPQSAIRNAPGPVSVGHPDFIIAEEEMPVNEIAVILFLRSNLCDKDWDAFIELFGIERPNVIGPPNVPKDKEDEYLAAAERIANGEGGFLPNGSDVKYPGQRTGAGDPFKQRLDYLQEQIVLAGTGGLLTMLAKPTGMGSGVSDEQGDGFDQVAQTKAREISELFNRQFDLEVLALHHPGEPVCAYFELCAQEQEDVTELVTNVATLKNAGFKADAEELSEKTGLKLEKDSGQSSVVSGQPDASPASDNEQLTTDKITNRADVSQIASALHASMSPLVSIVEAIAAEEDPEVRQRMLEKVLNREPQFRAWLQHNSQVASLIAPELEKEFAGALANPQSAIRNPQFP